MVTVTLDPSARLLAQARDPDYQTTEEEVARVRGVTVELHDYPHAGDYLYWEDGTTYTVKDIAWPLEGAESPLVTIE